jgi:hypothetical protein
VVILDPPFCEVGVRAYKRRSACGSMVLVFICIFALCERKNEMQKKKVPLRITALIIRHSSLQALAATTRSDSIKIAICGKVARRSAADAAGASTRSVA